MVQVECLVAQRRAPFLPEGPTPKHHCIADEIHEVLDLLDRNPAELLQDRNYAEEIANCVDLAFGALDVIISSTF